MRDRIPTEISDRCTFTNTQYDQHNTRITAIKPIDPCPCGRKLEDIRRVRLQKMSEPKPHWREYCYTCRLVSLRDKNTWYSATDLNAIIRRSSDFSKG